MSVLGQLQHRVLSLSSSEVILYLHSSSPAILVHGNPLSNLDHKLRHQKRLRNDNVHPSVDGGLDLLLPSIRRNRKNREVFNLPFVLKTPDSLATGESVHGRHFPVHEYQVNGRCEVAAGLGMPCGGGLEEVRSLDTVICDVDLAPRSLKLFA